MILFVRKDLFFTDFATVFDAAFWPLLLMERLNKLLDDHINFPKNPFKDIDPPHLLCVTSLTKLFTSINTNIKTLKIGDHPQE
jgi:hypothetical protein